MVINPMNDEKAQVEGDKVGLAKLRSTIVSDEA